MSLRYFQQRSLKIKLFCDGSSLTQNKGCDMWFLSHDHVMSGSGDGVRGSGVSGGGGGGGGGAGSG